MSENKNHEQEYYNNLIMFSNTAHENTKQNAYTQDFWRGKSDAYDYAATCFVSYCFLKGIYIKTKVSNREKEIEEARNEKMRVDCSLEEKAFKG